MNQNCAVCKSIQDRDVKSIFEDDKILAFLAPNPATVGHTIIVPKEHYAIIEQVPDLIMGHMLSISNKISAALFDSLGVHGTNILMQNGVEAGQKHPHFCIHVIPRVEGDKMKLHWQTLTPTQDDLETAELQLKDSMKNIGSFEKEKAPPIVINEEKQVYTEDDEEENYLIRQLRRIP